MHAEFVILPRPLSPPPSFVLNHRAVGGQSHSAPVGKYTQCPAESLGDGITSLSRMMEHRITLGSCSQGSEGSPAPRRTQLVCVGSWYGCAFFSRCGRNIPTWFFFFLREETEIISPARAFKMLGRKHLWAPTSWDKGSPVNYIYLGGGPRTFLFGSTMGNAASPNYYL